MMCRARNVHPAAFSPTRSAVTAALASTCTCGPGWRRPLMSAGWRSQDECQPCPAGTYSSNWGSATCKKCGHGTVSRQGASNCDISALSCQYRVNDNTVYDLHALARVKKPMWGPIVDLNASQSYYINMCSMDNTNGTCVGRDGYSIRTFACQQGTIQDDWWSNTFAVRIAPQALRLVGCVRHWTGM